MTSLKVGRLRFKSLEIDGRESISTDLTDEQAFGIYAYEFTDGMWYVGKSTDVRKRHVSHMHDYRHDNPPRVPKQMLWAEVKGNEQQLDYAESDAISWFEQRGYDLLNIQKTGRPRGNFEVIVDTGADWGVPIPWERENLPASTRTFAYKGNASMKKRFKLLKQNEHYNELIGVLRKYVRETIPAPADTAGSLWTVTALPFTNNKSRLCCISCQNAETLVVLKGDTPYGFVNMKRNADSKLPKWHLHHRTYYGTLPGGYRIGFASLHSLSKLLDDEIALDCCYRANAELMRRGASMYRRFNNPYLTEAILEGL